MDRAEFDKFMSDNLEEIDETIETRLKEQEGLKEYFDLKKDFLTVAMVFKGYALAHEDTTTIDYVDEMVSKHE